LCNYDKDGLLSVDVMKRFFIAIVISSVISACTSSGDIYSSSKHDEEDFDLGKTILLGIGAAALVGLAAAAAYFLTQPAAASSLPEPPTLPE